MKKQLTIEEQAYSNIVTFLEGLLDFHPEYFKDQSITHRDVLSKYYFWGRDVDVDNVFRYRLNLLEKDNSIKLQAESALDEFLVRHRIKKSSTDYKSWL